MTALQDANAEVRRSAAGGLERKRDARAVDPLILALRDEDSHVRNFAAQALGTIGDPRSIDPLVIVLLKDKDGSVRFQAKRALERITGEDIGENPSDWRR
jgi:HEAT repeat protein